MAEVFEETLNALFADVPEAPDAADFVAAFEARMDAYQRRRRLVLGLFGLIGLVVAAAVLGLTANMNANLSNSIDALAKAAPWAASGLLVTFLTLVAVPSGRRI
jgi:hypothetical protein